jgi:subtilisin family serine protease
MTMPLAADLGLDTISDADGVLTITSLAPLMARTAGRREVIIALVDGPVDVSHPGLTPGCKTLAPDPARNASIGAGETARIHGTSVAGILAAKRGSAAPGICPGCTLLIRPIFAQADAECADLPAATPADLGDATIDVVDAGARVINLSIALAGSSAAAERALCAVLDYAMRREVLVVAAAGNEGTVGSSAITRHAGVIPVAAAGRQGRLMALSNLGLSIACHGLTAPGDAITSLAAGGGYFPISGTSAAAPFVTGAIALLWSEFPDASAAQVKYAVVQSRWRGRKTLTPPMLDAWRAYRVMLTNTAG